MELPCRISTEKTYSEIRTALNTIATDDREKRESVVKLKHLTQNWTFWKLGLWWLFGMQSFLNFSLSALHCKKVMLIVLAQSVFLSHSKLDSYGIIIKSFWQKPFQGFHKNLKLKVSARESDFFPPQMNQKSLTQCWQDHSTLKSVSVMSCVSNKGQTPTSKSETSLEFCVAWLHLLTTSEKKQRPCLSAHPADLNANFFLQLVTHCSTLSSIFQNSSQRSLYQHPARLQFFAIANILLSNL